MKTLNRHLTLPLVALALTASCAGMFNKTPTTIGLYNMPANYTITDNGAPAEIDLNYQTHGVFFAGQYTYSSTVSHGPAVILDRTIAHDIIIGANGLTRLLHIDRGSIGAGWVWLDLTLGFGVGAIIDAVSGAWRGAQAFQFDGATMPAPATPVVVAPVAAPVPVAVAPLAVPAA